MKIRLNVFGLLLVTFLFTPVSLLAANIYVDQTLISDCTAGNYSTLNRDCGGSDGNAYRTLEAASGALSPGDTLLLRGGTYTENYGDTYNAMPVPTAANGDSWEEGHYTTISSYPGEWAKLDGSASSKRFTTGLGTSGAGGAGVELKYWLFERLEITNNSPTARGGIAVHKGPVKIRYCYIHDVRNGTNNDNPAGLRAYHLRDSLIEYNWFKNNGGPYGKNCANIAIFTDYKYCYDGDLSNAVQNNTIRYNLLSGDSYIGFKHKAPQVLTDEKSPDLTNKNLGDKIHHNIVQGTTVAIEARQDFSQVYNNIVDDGMIQGPHVTSAEPQKVYVFFYNNTVTQNSIWHPVGYNSTDLCGRDYPLEHFHPYLYVANNIVSEHENVWDHVSITTGYRGMDPQAVGNTLDISDLIIDRNLIYKPVENKNFPGDHILVGRNAGPYSGSFTVSEFNTQYGVKNYLSTNDNLFKADSGANKYKTYSTFSLGGSDTVANGGIGGSHPYLTGVTIPSYVGATNPNLDSGLKWYPETHDPDDAGWVDFVLSLSNVDYLMGRPKPVTNLIIK